MPHLPISYPKIRVPRRRSDTLSRPRLLDELNDNLIDHTLNLISAPAGSGKTTVLIDYAHQQDMPVCWYALDDLDRDLFRFVAHFIASIQQKFRSFGEVSSSFIRDSADLVRSLTELVVTLSNDIYHNITENFVIVLDDYHLVHGTAEIDQFINQFAQQVSDNCHLVIASRTLPTFEDTILLTARGQIYGFDFEQIAFQASEVQALILQNEKRSISFEEAQALIEQTEGWITGLTLVPKQQQAQQSTAVNRPWPLKAGVSLDDYFNDQVFATQPAEVRSFLLETSILEAFDSKLCRDVFGAQHQAEELIQFLIEKNLFVVGIDLPGNWVRYHHLFRDFLQAKLQLIDPERVEEIRAKLANVYAERHDWDKAQALYYQLGNYEEIVNLIEASRATFGDNGRFRTLINWIESLPTDFLEKHVQIKALKGFLSIELGDTSAMELLHEIEGPLRERGEMVTLARILMARSTGHRILRRYEASFEDAQEALRLIEQAEPDKPSPIKAGALRQIGLHLYDTGQMDEAQKYYDQALAIYEQINDVSGGAMVYLNKGMAYRLQGAYQKAEQAYQAAIDRWATYKNVIRQANVLNSLGVLQHTRGDYHRAYRTLEQAIEYAKQIGSIRIQAFAFASLGDVYKDLAAFVAAHRSYHEARQLAETIQSNALLFYLDLVEISCCRLEQKLVQAQAALDNLSEGRTPYEQGMYQRECGLLALAQGDPAAALAHLKSAQDCLGRGDYLTEQVQLAVYLAVTAAQLGDVEFAKKQLGHATYIASQIDNQHVLVAAAYEVRNWLANWNDSYAQQLYHETESLHETNTEQRKLLRQQGSAVALAPPEFKIETLGTIQIYNNEEEVTSPEWQKHKIVKALFFLLLSHTRALTKEEIGVELWPDASTKSLKTAFKNALYRLRVALGKDVIYYDEVLGRYSFNRTLDYVWDVEQMLHGLDNAAVATDPAEKLRLYTDSLAHYKGEYLPLMDGSWVESMRTDLERQYQQATLDCGLLALQEQAYKLAAKCGHDLISLDQCNEEAYRLLMRTYAAQGNRAQMHRQYLACKKALMDDLKLEPSTQTQELYRQLS